MMDTRTNKLLEVHSFSRDSTAAKGGFDKDGNPWFGGRGGALLELDVKAAQIREFWPPTPYVTFYEAMPDKRGEVWAGELHGGRMVRFNPQADHWTEYVLPEPYSHDRRNLDRQFHHAGHRLVRRPQQLSGPRPAAGIGGSAKGHRTPLCRPGP